MLVFITSIRHPDNSSDYGRVEALLQDTLASLTGQDSDDYRVFVVGNREPSFPLHEKVTFVTCDFPPPPRVDGVHPDIRSLVRDKGSKLGLALVAARPLNPDHVMIVDADDYVSRRLVSAVAAGPLDQGWVVDDGWKYASNRGTIKPRPEFYERCGSCLAIPYSAYRVPEELTVESTQDEVVKAYGKTLTRALGKHKGAMQWLQKNRNVRIEPFLFRAAVYHVDTGENHSGSKLPGFTFPVTQKFCEEFNVTSPIPTWVRYWNAFGPVAAWGFVLSIPERIGWLRDDLARLGKQGARFARRLRKVNR